MDSSGRCDEKRAHVREVIHVLRVDVGLQGVRVSVRESWDFALVPSNAGEDQAL